MTFSIIIPAHNSAEHIRRALDSVKSQTFTDYELIVICDACEDNTAEIAREYTDKVYEVINHSGGLSLNDGLDRASGKWVLFIDDDDWWLHEYVLQQLMDQLDDEADLIAFGFIFKSKGYAAPAGNHGQHWIAPWCKVWRRSFIGGSRFIRDFPSDLYFHACIMDKHPVIKKFDMPVYYYNYMRPGSYTWKLENGGL